MAIYRKRDLVQAVQFNGTPVWDEVPDRLRALMENSGAPYIYFSTNHGFPTANLHLGSGEGSVANQGDYLVFHDDGKVEVMSQKDFKKTYEKATL